MSYMSSHNRVRRIRGGASTHSCARCPEQAQEWAYIHGSVGERSDANGRVYSPDVNEYMPLCYRCHRVYDKSTTTHCPKGHEYDKGNTIIDAGKRKCKTCVYARNRARSALGLSESAKARKLELQRGRRAAARVARGTQETTDGA